MVIWGLNRDFLNISMIELINNDCMNAMANMQSGSIDMVMVKAGINAINTV